MSGVGIIRKNLKSRQRQMLFSGVQQAKAWKLWLNSQEGIECSRGTTSGEYLVNRLWAAFNAGVEVALQTKRQKRERRKPSDD